MPALAFPNSPRSTSYSTAARARTRSGTSRCSKPSRWTGGRCGAAGSTECAGPPRWVGGGLGGSRGNKGRMPSPHMYSPSIPSRVTVPTTPARNARSPAPSTCRCWTTASRAMSSGGAASGLPSGCPLTNEPVRGPAHLLVSRSAFRMHGALCLLHVPRATSAFDPHHCALAAPVLPARAVTSTRCLWPRSDLCPLTSQDPGLRRRPVVLPLLLLGCRLRCR